MQTIKFTIHGSGIFIKRFHKDRHEWKAYKFHSSKELTRMIFNHDLFQKMHLKNSAGESLSSYYDLVPDESSVAYHTDRFTSLEIKVEGKRHGRIGFYDLVRTDILFPSYPTTQSEFKMKDLNFIECDIGIFGSASLKVDKFNIQLLRFESVDFQGQPFIHKIIYNDIVLEFKRTNTLNQGNFAVNCNS